MQVGAWRGRSLPSQPGGEEDLHRWCMQKGRRLIVEIEVAREEWEAVVRKVVPFVGADEAHSNGRVALAADGRMRTWWAFDDQELARLHGPSDSRDYWFVLPVRLLQSWPFVAGGSDSATLSMDVPPGGVALSAKLHGIGGSVELPLPGQGFADVEAIFDHQTTGDGATVDIDVEALAEVIRVARFAPLGALEADVPVPYFWVTVDPDGLMIEIDWGEYGASCYRLPGRGAGRSSLVVAPDRLAALVDSLSAGEVRFTLPTDPSLALRLEQGRHVAMVMPVDPDRPAARRCDECLEEVFGPEVLLRDADGDYVLTNYGVPVYGRFIGGSAPYLRLFSPVVHDIAAHEELLDEINQLNLGIAFARVAWSSGAVFVSGELVASSIDPPELITLFERVRDVADGLGPALAARFGGQSAQPSEEARWALYTRTTVTVEMGQHEWVDLSGPDAVDAWPFPGDVHVVTASNPHGRRRPPGQDSEATAQLAADLIRAGGTAVRAEGKSYDGRHKELSLLTWGLDTDTVREIARWHGQEAFFRLDADWLEVLGVFVDRSARRPRREIVEE